MASLDVDLTLISYASVIKRIAKTRSGLSLLDPAACGAPQVDPLLRERDFDHLPGGALRVRPATHGVRLREQARGEPRTLQGEEIDFPLATLNYKYLTKCIV